MLDFTSDFGKRAADRLSKATIIWLTTVGGDGTPQPSPVWFLWDGESALIYSQPDTPKIRNIGRHAQVTLNLDGDGDGGDIIILTGTATVEPIAPPATEIPAYLAKYGPEIAKIGMTPESFAASYSATIRVTPTKLRGN